MISRLQSMMLVESTCFPQIQALLSVLLEELALQARQIVHQYNYQSCFGKQCDADIRYDACWLFFQFCACVISAILSEMDNGLVLMEGKHELTSTYVALLDQIRSLLSRDSLCNNTYLFQQMKQSLTVPLYIIAEERRVAAITSDEQQIAQAIEESGLARVSNNREVTIIEYPTVKISTKSIDIFHELQRVLREKEIKHSFSERLEKEKVNLTIYSQDIEFLEQLIVSLSKEVEFERASLYEDIRAGTSRIRKLKQEQKHNGNFAGKAKYSLDKPPQIFIRRAVPSDDEEDEEKQRAKHSGERRKKYKQVTKESSNIPTSNSNNKPVFNNDDFPSLS